MASLPHVLLSELSRSVAERVGLHFPPERWQDLEVGVQAAARELGIDDVAACARGLLDARLDGPQMEVLINALTIGETYFFRDPRGLCVLSEHVLPALIRARRGVTQRLRIWSAGCCTGEEAYSIAIILERLLPDFSDWQVTLLATDVNARFLQRAVEGVYGEWSFRGAPSWLKGGYFRKAGPRHFAITPRIKERVTFAHLNLGQDVYPSLDTNTNAMDLILCRNVLIYFSAERKARVARNFHHSLVPDGWLLVSAVETDASLSEYFAAETYEGATAYRKKGTPAPGPAVHVSAAVADTHCTPAGEPPPHYAPRPTHIARHAAADPATGKSGNDEMRKQVALPVKKVAAPGADGAGPAYRAALALFEQGRYAEAAAALQEQAATVRADVATATLMARIYANLGELAEARSWAERAICVDRTDAACHYLRAMIVEEQELIAEAFLSLQRTLYLAPGFVLAHFALGNLTLRQGKRDEALRHFNNALAFLKNYADGDVLPHSDGLAAGRLREMIHSIAPRDIAA